MAENVVVAALAVKVIVIGEPSVTVPVPVRVMASVGTTVSTVKEMVLPARLPLPDRSVKALAGTPIVAGPWYPGVGVNVAEERAPEPVRPERLPPVTVTLARPNVLEG